MMRKTIAIIALVGSALALPVGCTSNGKSGIAQGPRISTQTHLASARMLEATGNFAGATKQYEHVIENEPDMALAYHRLAVLYVRLGYLDKAQDTLQKAIEKGADEASLRNNLGYTLLRMNRLDDAEQMLDAALAISPNFHRARMNLAICHAKAGRTESALMTFSEVVPQDQAFYNLGVIRLQERDYVTSAWAFNEAMTINPALPGVREKATQAVALARHAPHHPADQELLAALTNPQSGGAAPQGFDYEPLPVRIANAETDSTPTAPTFAPMQPAQPTITNQRPPRTAPTDAYAANPTAPPANNPSQSVPTYDATPAMTPLASAGPVSETPPQRKIVNSRPPRTAPTMTPLPSTPSTTKPRVAFPLKTVAPMSDVPEHASTTTFDTSSNDSNSESNWSDDWDETESQNDTHAATTPMQLVDDASYSRVPTTEPEVQDVAYDASYEADCKTAETTWQKWFLPPATTKQNAGPEPAPMVEVSGGPSASTAAPTKSSTSANAAPMTPVNQPCPSKSTNWNNAKTTKPVTTTAKPKRSPLSNNATSMQMLPASNNNKPAPKPTHRHRSNKAIIKPIDHATNDDAVIEPMQPASREDSDNKKTVPARKDESTGDVLEMTPLA